MMELGLEIVERPLAEAETKGFGQADFPDGRAPSIARPAKRAKTTMRAQSRRDDESAQKCQDIWRAEEGSPKATMRVRLAAKCPYCPMSPVRPPCRKRSVLGRLCNDH